MVLTLCNKVYLCYVTHFNMHELETIVFCHSGSNPGHFRRQTTPSAMANYCLVILSSYSFLCFSGNTSFSHTSLHPILTKLGQSDRYLNHYSHTKDGGVRGHDGVTGVKKVIFTKKASSPSEYVALTRDLCICISLTPSTKVISLKNHPGSFGVTGVKRSFSLKML